MTEPVPRSPRALILAGVVLVAAGLVSAAFLNLIVHRQQEDERRRAGEVGTQCAYLLEKQLDQLLAAPAPLAAFFRQRAEIADFASLAAGVLESSPGLSSIVLAPDGRVTEVYPSGAGGIELDLAPPELGGAEGGAGPEPRLSDPIRQSDGTLIVFSLHPVVLKESTADADRPWGYVGAALRIDDLSRAARLGDLTEEGYHYHLSVLGPTSGSRRAVLRSTELELEEPLELPVSERGGAGWMLALAPRDGWPGWSSYRSHMLFAGVLALVAALLTHELARQPERLRRQVDQRSHRLRKTKRRLDAERRQRAEAEARETWRDLDRFSRMALVAAGRPGDPEGASESSIVRAVSGALEAVGMEFRAEEVRSGLYRLEELGVLARDKFDRLRVEKPILFSLPETQKELAEIARDTMERIGPYRIERRLGGGGMGEVFQAKHEKDDSTAAVKLLYPHALEDQEQRQRFEREGTMVARLDHPNIVRLLDRGEHLNRLYIAMEMVEGETLEHLIRRRGPLASAEALAILWDVGQALATLHDLGVVHRDVKSSNVMRTPAGRSVLLDFGLARSMSSHGLTRSDAVLGTVPYMAPERLRGKRGTPQIDVWAAGLLLYEVLAGRLPWKNPEELTLVNEILMTRDMKVRERLPKTADPGVLDLLEDMLAVSPEDRLPDGEAIVRGIAAITGWSPVTFDADCRGAAPLHPAPSRTTGPARSNPRNSGTVPLTVPAPRRPGSEDTSAITVPRRTEKN